MEKFKFEQHGIAPDSCEIVRTNRIIRDESEGIRKLQLPLVSYVLCSFRLLRAIQIAQWIVTYAQLIVATDMDSQANLKTFYHENLDEMYFKISSKRTGLVQDFKLDGRSKVLCLGPDFLMSSNTSVPDFPDLAVVDRNNCRIDLRCPSRRVP